MAGRRPAHRGTAPQTLGRVHASARPTVTVTTDPAAAALEASARSRTVSVLALPYGRPGRLTQGNYTVRPGAPRLPEDLGRVKLLTDHRTKPGATSVGHMIAAEHTDAGLVCTFAFGTGEAADRALADALERTRDAVSVELSEVAFAGSEIADAYLDAVALVDVPAFDDARVLSVHATARTNQGDTPMDRAAMIAAMIANGMTQAAAEAAAVSVSASAAPAVATAPAGLTHIAARPADLSFAGVLDTLIAARSGQRDSQVFAALANITQTMAISTQNAAWLGELWDGAPYERTVVPLVTTKTLTTPKAVGWKWATKPTIAPYAGDKAEIPTGTSTFSKIEVDAQRLAYGADFDRIFWDFGQTEVIAGWFRHLAASYLEETDEIVAGFIAASAPAVTGVGSTATPAADMLRAAAIGAQSVKLRSRTTASFVLVNPTDMLTLLDFSQLDSPEFLDVLGVGPDRWTASEFVAPGQVLVGAKRAVEFHELGSTPVRVSAEHIAHGGRDEAVFGYHAELLTSNKGLAKVAFAAPVAGGGGE